MPTAIPSYLPILIVQISIVRSADADADRSTYLPTSNNFFTAYCIVHKKDFRLKPQNEQNHTTYIPITQDTHKHKQEEDEVQLFHL